MIYEQKDLLKAAKEEILKTKEELGAKPEEAQEIIKFLNTKNKQELDEIGITDITETILEVRKVISKKNLMKQLEEKCQNTNMVITRFMVKFDTLRQKGLPNILVTNDKLMKQEDYNKKIRDFAKDQVNKADWQGVPTSKVLCKSIENLFYLQHDIKHLFVVKPTFVRYTEANENFRKLTKIKLLEEDELIVVLLTY